MVVIDWLSVNYHGIYNDSKLFKIKHLEYGTKMFKNVTELYHNSDLVCIIVYNPRSTILDKNLIQIKYANKQLYHAGLFDLIQMVESDLNLQFVGFSRIDLAYDFNSFYKSLSPELFINRVASGKYIKKGLANYKFIAKNQNKVIWQYFRIGSDTSNIQGYLYNKTAEMRDKKNKPYIVEGWKNSGLDLSKDVWRLEFSIKGDAWNLIDRVTNENIEHSCIILYSDDLKENVFSLLVDKLFTFYKNTGKVRKDRNIKLRLFENFFSSPLLMQWCKFEDSTRSDKMLINKLLTVYDEIREFEKDEAFNIYEITKNFSTRKQLSAYMYKKEIEKNLVL